MDIKLIKQEIESTLLHDKLATSPDRSSFETQVSFPRSAKTLRKSAKEVLRKIKHHIINFPLLGPIANWFIAMVRIHIRIQRAETIFTANEARLDRDFLETSKRFNHLEHHLNLMRQELADLRSAMSVRLMESKAGLPNVVSTDNEQLRSLYLNFESRFRATPESILASFAAYDEELVRLPSTIKSLPAVDVGCGRGEWLKYLRSKGFNPIGVDSNEAMAEAAQANGFNVKIGDGITFLRELPSASCAIVSAFHVVEHLPLEVLLNLIGEAFRVLAPQGIAIFETPNPENILTGACNFYTDPTHRNPIPPHTLDFLVLQRGFDTTHVIRKGKPEGIPTSDNPAVKYMLEWFRKEQDYAIVAYKR